MEQCVLVLKRLDLKNLQIDISESALTLLSDGLSHFCWWQKQKASNLHTCMHTYIHTKGTCRI